MRKPVRIALRILGGLVGLVLLVVLVSYVVSGSRLRRRYDVAGKEIPIPTDSASVARGKVLATLYGCNGCHAANLGGQIMIAGFPFARLASTNITTGQGSAVADYSVADWDRAVRHGLRKDGTPLFIMPSDAFNRMNDEEFGRLVAYLKTVPPVDKIPVTRVVYPLARVFHTFGAPLVPAEKIDHATQRNPQPPRGATMAYGDFVAGSCKFCHGEDLGGREVGGEAGAPPSPPIGRASVVARWTEAQFFHAMRTGVTPDGRTLRPQYMPWPEIGQLGDDELRALHMSLKQGVTQTASSP